jgi:peptidyl-prolyl cis-trans isomerase C
MRNTKIILSSMLSLFLLLSLIACEVDEPTPTAVLDTPTEQTPTPTFTPVPPTPTPVPLAARVNDKVITLHEFEAELHRYLASQELDQLETGDESELIVLQELIDRLLLAQLAWQNGFEFSDADLQARFANLVDEIGGQEEMDNWLQEHGYTETSFLESLRLSVAAAWMRDQVLLAVTNIAEQVRARQIFTTDPDQANQLYNQLQAGAEFATLAAELDPLFQGDLGWFSRGYLLLPELEDAAFELNPGEYSQVIQTRIGYHIVQVVERESERPLEPDAHLTLQIMALRDWVERQRQENDVQIYLPVSQE